MAKSSRVSDLVFKGFFAPTCLAYFWLIVGYRRSGLILFSVFLLWAYMVGAFKRVMDWPLIAKIALACSILLIGLGYYFSTQSFTSAMLVPGFACGVLGFVASFALQRLD